MRLMWLALSGALFLSSSAFGADSSVLKTEKDKVNYGIGVNMINTIRQQGVELDLELVVQGMKDAYAGGPLLLNDEELRKAVNQYYVAVKQKQALAQSRTSDTNKKEGEAFLAENGKRDGVVTLPSGLQYKILKAGEGKKPTEEDTVECHIRGSLVNGTEFESSYRTGHPATFKVAGLPPGLREALKLMPAESKWRLFVPSPLAYGGRGKAGSIIGPNAALIYEVELLAVK